MSGTTSPPPIAPSGMSPKQRFFFDLKGWLLVPSVLSQEDWTESLVHVGNDWTDPEHDRIATFALYNSLW